LPSLTEPGAHSTEFAPQADPPAVLEMLELSRTHMGGTMRLGLRPTVFQPGSDACTLRQLYGGAGTIWERHRHRYEVAPALVPALEQSGLRFPGRDEKGERMQVLDVPGAPPRFAPCAHALTPGTGHPFFVGLQAHPEFCSRPLNPSPAFLGLVAAACGPAVLAEQIKVQLATFRPPHPEHAMVSEAQIRNNGAPLPQEAPEGQRA
jgi:CTP synthase